MNYLLDEFDSDEKSLKNSEFFMNCILNCVNKISPSAIKSVAVSVSKVFWSDIGGYETVRRNVIIFIVASSLTIRYVEFYKLKYYYDTGAVTKI